ncbi:unnamed protein product, partial [Ectocarpus sp. 12 AP-2014]
MTQTATELPDNETVLVVDLDGTLCRTDTLFEVLFALVTTNPFSLLALPKWLGKGRAELKAHLADLKIMAADSLPMNPHVIEAVEEARATNRPTALVSAADHRQVTAIAEATGLFDQAYGSAEGRNLKGDEKAAFLIEQFGEGKYDYIGDSPADVPVWASARQALTVQANASLKRAAQTANSNTQHLDPPVGRNWAILHAMRPHQWTKNLLLFLPAVAAHNASNLLPIILGFIAFCLTASAVYVINDLTDLAADRAHPRKRNRPFAAGTLSIQTGLFMATGLCVLAFIFGLFTGNPLFLIVQLAYLVLTFAYSLWLKRKLVVDVLTLAGLYTIRILAGAAAATVVLSPWMMGFSIFIFLALAAVKRQAELTDQLVTQRESSGRAYEVDDLPVLRSIAISAANTAVLVLALYINSPEVQTLYASPFLL